MFCSRELTRISHSFGQDVRGSVVALLSAVQVKTIHNSSNTNRQSFAASVFFSNNMEDWNIHFSTLLSADTTTWDSLLPLGTITAAFAIGSAWFLAVTSFGYYLSGSKRRQWQGQSTDSSCHARRNAHKKLLSKERTNLIINRKVCDITVVDQQDERTHFPSLSVSHCRCYYALKQWKEVLEWVVFDPQQELLLPDKKGHTILHHLCLFRAPIEIIQMVLWTRPELAAVANVDGEIALHWAVRLSAPHECIRSLLQADRQTATASCDKEGHSPLSLFWDRYKDRFIQLWWEGNKKKFLSNRAWQRLILFFQPTTDDPAPCPLHVAAQSPCPPALFPLLIQVYNDKLHVLDNRGRNPLQIACCDPVSNRSTDLRAKIQNLLKQQDGGVSNMARHLDHDGRNAFLIALAAGVAWNEGLRELFDLMPQDLSTIDPVTRLPPFLLAAVGSSHRLAKAQAQKRADMLLSCSEKSLATIFQLLKMNPSCLELMKR